jgi:SAM-dependent methyltransferase
LDTTLHCLACRGTTMFDLFDLGKIPPVNGFSTTSNRENAFPLNLGVCLDCWLCQLTDAPDPDLLFRSYKHFSGASAGNLLHLREVAETVGTAMSDRSSVKVLEIGCNDGSLLELLRDRGFECIGVDPAYTMKDAHKSKGLKVIYDFFNEQLASRLLKSDGQFDLVIGLNVLAHFPTFISAYRGIRSLLKPGGLFHLEVADATETLANGRFDTIYHEHVCNYTLTSIDSVLRSVGLRGIRAEKIDTQGGSLRVLACAEDDSREEEGSYRALLEMDRSKGVDRKDFYLDVKAKTEDTISVLNRHYAEFCSGDEPVILLGAPARGVVMCNSTVLKDMTNLHCVDDTQAKLGCVIPGTEILVGGWDSIPPIGSTKAILLSWNYRDSMLQKLADTGFKGKVLIPLPETEVIDL